MKKYIILSPEEKVIDDRVYYRVIKEAESLKQAINIQIKEALVEGSYPIIAKPVNYKVLESEDD